MTRSLRRHSGIGPPATSSWIARGGRPSGTGVSTTTTVQRGDEPNRARSSAVRLAYGNRRSWIPAEAGPVPTSKHLAAAAAAAIRAGSASGIAPGQTKTWAPALDQPGTSIARASPTRIAEIIAAGSGAGVTGGAASHPPRTRASHAAAAQRAPKPPVNGLRRWACSSDPRPMWERTCRGSPSRCRAPRSRARPSPSPPRAST